jgi:succinate dehydrogenase hydrophobic anchor subunit
MLVKAFIVLVLLAILFSLFSGMMFLIRDKGQSDRTVTALTVRIALSVVLFILLMIAFATGLIQPHGVYPG